MTDKEIIRAAMSILGSKTSPAKARAARRNGRKGGRPKVNLTASISHAKRS